MSRPHRIEFPGAFYHVFARGNNKQKIFQDEQDYTVYLDRIERYHNRYKFILYAYALMSNHIHFAIETFEIPLSKIMQGIQQSYSQYVQKKYSYVGHLYQGPFGAVLYEKEESALNLVRYIHLNPVKACLVENPKHYPWSSHRVYLNMEVCSFLDKKSILEMLPYNDAKAILMFNEFVLEGLQILEQVNFDDVKGRQIIGRKNFIEEVKNKIEKNSFDPEFDKNNHFLMLRKKTLSEILKIVSKQTKVSADSIFGRSRLSEISEARRIFAFIAAKQDGYRLVEISKFLKQGDSSITRMIHKIESELKFNLVLSEKLGKISQVMKARPRS